MPEPDLTSTRLAGDEGSAAVLVVGPSLGTSVEALWGAAATLLGDRFEVVGWDLPGHGRSKPADDPLTLSGLASAVRRIAAGAAGGRPCYAAGISVAGGVALELALEPGPFAAVACLAGAARFGEPGAWHERAALVRRDGTPELVPASTERWFAPGFPERDPGTTDRLLLSLRDTDDTSYARVCEALAAFDLRDRLAAAQVPVLVGPGELDVVIPPAVAQETTARPLPDSTLHVFTGCGHLPAAEDPASVATVLRDSFAPGGER